MTAEKIKESGQSSPHDVHAGLHGTVELLEARFGLEERWCHHDDKDAALREASAEFIEEDMPVDPDHHVQAGEAGHAAHFEHLCDALRVVHPRPTALRVTGPPSSAVADQDAGVELLQDFAVRNQALHMVPHPLPVPKRYLRRHDVVARPGRRRRVERSAEGGAGPAAPPLVLA